MVPLKNTTGHFAKIITLFFAVLYVNTSDGQMFKKGLEVRLTGLESYRYLRDATAEQDQANIIQLSNSFVKPVPGIGMTVQYRKGHTRRIFTTMGVRYSRLGFKGTTDVSGGTIVVDGKQVKRVTETIVYHTFSFPIMVGYTLIYKRRFNFFLSAGLGLDFHPVTYRRLDYFFDNGGVKREVDTHNMTENFPVSLFTNWGAGIQYRVHKRGALQCFVSRYQNISDVNKDPVRIRLTAYMVDLGYIVRL